MTDSALREPEGGVGVHVTIYELMGRVLADIGAVGKNKRNEFHKYSYRSADDVLDGLHPAFAKHQVFVIPEMLDVAINEGTTSKDKVTRRALVKVLFHFCGPAGDRITAGPVFGEGQDSEDKAVAKALTAAFKPAMTFVFAIPFNLEDADHDDDRRVAESREADESAGTFTPSASVVELNARWEAALAQAPQRTRDWLVEQSKRPNGVTDDDEPVARQWVEWAEGKVRQALAQQSATAGNGETAGRITEYHRQQVQPSTPEQAPASPAPFEAASPEQQERFLDLLKPLTEVAAKAFEGWMKVRFGADAGGFAQLSHRDAGRVLAELESQAARAAAP